MKCSARIALRAGPVVLSKYSKLPLRTLTAPTDTRVAPWLMRSKSTKRSSVLFSCEVS
jgi:hypothetical protein